MSEHLHDLLKKNLKVFFKPIYSSLLRPEIFEISISRYDEIWLKTESGIERAEAAFKEEKLKIAVINLLQLFGASLSKERPHASLKAPEGLKIDLWFAGEERVPLLLFSKPRRMFSVSLSSLAREGVLSKVAQLFLQGLLESRQSILVTGGPAEFRQKFFRALLRELPEYDRKLFMPANDKPLQLPFSLKLEHPNHADDSLPSDRLRNFSSLQPARLLLEDLAPSDSVEVLNLLLEGFRGSVVSVDAVHPRAAFQKLELSYLSRSDFPIEMIRQQIALAFPWVIHLDSLPGGELYISSIQEVHPELNSRGGVVFRSVFVFQAQHRAEGWFRTLKTTGVVPSCLKEFDLCGFHSLKKHDFENQLDATLFKRAAKSQMDFLAAAQQLLDSEGIDSPAEGQALEKQKPSRALSSLGKKIESGEIGLEQVQQELSKAIAGKPVLRAPQSGESPELAKELSEETFEGIHLTAVTEKQSGLEKEVQKNPTKKSNQPSSWPSMTRTGSFVFTQAVKQENEEMHLLLDQDRVQAETDTLVKQKSVVPEDFQIPRTPFSDSEERSRPLSKPAPERERQPSDILSVSDMLPEDELRLVAEELKGTFTKDPSFNDTRMRESPRHAFSLQGVGSENLSETAALVSPESKDAMLLSGEYPGVPSSASPESGGSVELERANSFSESTAIPQRNNNNNNDRSVLVRRGVRHNSTFSVEHLSPEDQTYVRARASTKPRNPTFTDSESEGNKPD